VAAGIADSAGKDRLVVGAGVGASQTVRIEDTAGNVVANNAQVYPSSYMAGIPVGVTTLGQKNGAVLTATGPGGNPLVTAFDASLNPLGKTFTTFAGFTGGSFVS
jgi:hypothetical protein